MFEHVAYYAGGLLVGSLSTLLWVRGSRSSGQDALDETELDIANVAFIRAAGDELDDETIRTIGERANEYCEEWETPVRFDAQEVSGE